MPLANTRRRVEQSQSEVAALEEPAEIAVDETDDGPGLPQVFHEPNGPATVQSLTEPAVSTDQREREPAQFVRVVKGQLGAYPQGSNVLTIMFEPNRVRQLLDMGIIEYNYEATEASPVDHDIAVAATLSRPLSLPGSIPNAPWVSATAGDLLGPAVARPTRFTEPTPAFQIITDAGGTHASDGSG